jgi:hypothetical protein
VNLVSFSSQYRQAIEALARPPTSDDGTPVEEIADGERRLGTQLPSALREYYLVAGRFDRLNRAHNRLYPPHDWFADAGKLVFMEENQEVAYWGVPITDDPEDDPPVLQGVNVSDQPIEWYPEDGRCAEFLLVMLHWQAVCGGMPATGGADIRPAILPRIRASWRSVGEVGGVLALARDGGAVCVHGEGEALQLFAGGRTEDDFRSITAELARLDVTLSRA